MKNDSIFRKCMIVYSKLIRKKRFFSKNMGGAVSMQGGEQQQPENKQKLQLGS